MVNLVEQLIKYEYGMVNFLLNNHLLKYDFLPKELLLLGMSGSKLMGNIRPN